VLYLYYSNLKSLTNCKERGKKKYMQKLLGAMSFLFFPWLIWNLGLWAQEHKGVSLSAKDYQEFLFPLAGVPTVSLMAIWAVHALLMRIVYPPKKTGETRADPEASPVQEPSPKGSSKN